MNTLRRDHGWMANFDRSAVKIIDGGNEYIKITNSLGIYYYTIYTDSSGEGYMLATKGGSALINSSLLSMPMDPVHEENFYVASDDYWIQCQDGFYVETIPSGRKFYHRIASGKLAFTEDPAGNMVYYEYSGGRCVSIYDNADEYTRRSIQISYNSQGLIDTVVDPYGAVTSFAYNGGNLLSSIISPEGS